MRFISANPLCFTLIINPALSSSFKERLTVISHRESATASYLTGKYTNRIPFSSSISFVSMASSIWQYITFAVLLIGSPASAFGNGIQGGSGVSAVINPYSICLVSPFIFVYHFGAVSGRTSGHNPSLHTVFKPLTMQAGRVIPLPAYCVIPIFSTVQPVLPDAVPAPGSSGGVLLPLVRSLR